ncbi:ATP synthase subunit I [Ramlibacter ginsenosidimutans]|uniref:ATP synthase subunit I n=1 Tax=Ramlibacter ginsenosidimutans TaxID=502333 RepID=A0A934TRJ0_9BURK|nr:ATP synthase subunit I [Ramlibacter ginsenosidimutans]MBK6006045.1 ATP synthase subunit I [Ramlibacter ginsenosidimutans]
MPTRRIAPLPEEPEEASPVQPLSAEEVRRVRERNPPLSPWRVVAGQAGVGLVAALLAWVFTGKQNVGWSVGYGALAVLLPAAVFARGLTGRFSSVNAGTAAAGFLVWEMVKVALTLAMLLVAPRLVAGLSWPALLVGLVLAMKVYWVALAFAPRPKTKSS